MADFLLEINDSGDTLEINDSNDQLLILDDTIVAPAEGGQSGGSSKQVGESIFDHDQSIPKKKKRVALGERLVIKSRAESIGKIHTKSITSAFGSLVIQFKAISECIVKPRLALAISVSSLVITEKIRSNAQIVLQEVGEAQCKMNPMSFIINGILSELIKHQEASTKIEKIKLLHEIFKNIEDE